MLQKLSLCRFTAFDDAMLSFSRGVNVFIGANATGKTHVMKLAYSILRAWGSLSVKESPASRTYHKFLAEVLAMKLAAVFRPDEGKIARLVRSARGRNGATIQLVLGGGVIDFTVTTTGALRVRELREATLPPSLFLPAREVLSIYPGFFAAYHNRELAFDETYADLCFALSGSPLRGPRRKAAALLCRPLAESLRADVSLEGDHFFLSSDDDGKIEAHLAAEGFRKIASLMHLIANGSLMKNSVLFWDEPEANLNPKLIKIVADFLLQLGASGVQVFVATHDYLLTNELSLNAEYQTQAADDAPIRFFAFSRGDHGGVEVQSGGTLAELDRNPIMEEFEALYDRERGLFYQSDRVE
jgi:putative AbiEii toxin of type IV toxin-antitoxin system/AAA domain-containing protein